MMSIIVRTVAIAAIAVASTGTIAITRARTTVVFQAITVEQILYLPHGKIMNIFRGNIRVYFLQLEQSLIFAQR